SAPVLYASASQVNYLVPASVALGRLDVGVRDGDRILARGSLELDRVAPGLFSANGDGRGVAAAQIVRVKASGAQGYEPVAQFDAGQNQFVPAPIDFGDPTDRLFLLLYGTGFRNASAATLLIGTIAVPLQYAGKQPQFIGLDQANAELPRSLIGAGNVAVTFAADGKAANPVTLTFR
ncbi:MAG TPA: hypothetical protein VGV35_15860, partial [Bryobacteraceae bacterium]|nr:hypothetical protein [Bryobacteraceae bacterium]